MSLKSVNGLTYDEALRMLAFLISNECARLYDLMESDRVLPVYKDVFENLLMRKADESDLQDSLVTLMRMLHAHYGQKVILLIDEYDVPLDKANDNGYYREMVNFLRGFLGEAFKTNPDLYWENSSSNQLIRHFIDIADVTEQDDIERLIAGKALEKKLVMNLTYDELDKKELLWSVLYQTGYLTLDENSRSKLRGYAKFVIPNREVREIFIEKIQDWFAEKMAVTGRNGLYEEIWSGDAAALQMRLCNILMDTISYYDYHENYYHALLVGLLLDGTHLVRSNYEMGKGRSDIVIEDGRNRRAAIIETKRAAGYEFLEEDSRKAIEQIMERQYGWPYQRRGYRVITYGISFSEKDCHVEVNEL